MADKTKPECPEWAKHFGEAILPYPPEGDWYCRGVQCFKSPEYIFHPKNGFEPGRFVFVPFYMDPIWSPAGENLPYTVMIFENIGADVAAFERGFKERCGMR